MDIASMEPPLSTQLARLPPIDEIIEIMYTPGIISLHVRRHRFTPDDFARFLAAIPLSQLIALDAENIPFTPHDIGLLVDTCAGSRIETLRLGDGALPPGGARVLFNSLKTGCVKALMLDDYSISDGDLAMVTEHLEGPSSLHHLSIVKSEHGADAISKLVDAFKNSSLKSLCMQNLGRNVARIVEASGSLFTLMVGDLISDARLAGEGRDAPRPYSHESRFGCIELRKEVGE